VRGCPSSVEGEFNFFSWVGAVEFHIMVIQGENHLSIVEAIGVVVGAIVGVVVQLGTLPASPVGSTLAPIAMYALQSATHSV